MSNTFLMEKNYRENGYIAHCARAYRNKGDN
jgi:hypothetical protein